MINLDTEIIIIIAILLLITGAIIWRIISAFLKHFTIRSRFNKGRKGELIARKYLLRHGYTILGQQVSRVSTIIVDNVAYNYEVRVDFLVQKGGRTGIVEVKTGDTAANPLSIPTRRQLFEYYHIFNVDVLYFFNAGKRILQRITFP